ncbi:MAG: TraB family protein [Desulfuromonadales bacterium]
MDNEKSSDLKRLHLGDREIVLLGTAHISQTSVDAVQQAIEAESPDCVCVELDSQRRQALKDQNRWQSLDLAKAIRKGQGPFLLTNLVLASFQKRMGLQTGVKPGAELAAAADLAEEKGLTLRLVDRDLRTTLLRAWRKTGWWKKMNLVSVLIASLFEKQSLDEAELARLRQTDALSVMLEEMGSLLPSVKTILVDERDLYMAQNIRLAPGQKILAVVGAAHVPGIMRQLTSGNPSEDIAEISSIPGKSAFSKAIPWLIPAVVVALFVVGFFFGDRERLAGAAVAWILPMACCRPLERLSPSVIR